LTENVGCFADQQIIFVERYQSADQQSITTVLDYHDDAVKMTHSVFYSNYVTAGGPTPTSFNTFVAGMFQPNSKSLHMSCRQNNFFADCAKELFKPSNDSASL